MKKVAAVLFVAGMFAFFACGPSAEEKAAMEKAKQDSIAAVQKAYDDSVAMALEQVRQDSIRIADSIAAAAEAGKKK
ncbi:MAG TPA: hypothetical protein P5531_12780 [Bacteroidales bacterium]|nr:hypothetical protein [Bacteroidales bacterium]HSA44432.1 hypothetical protein [Bacteroidales bacterium]